MRTLLIFILPIAILAVGCTQSDSSEISKDDDANYWLIPKDKVSNNDFSNKDHIVSINQPEFVKADEVDFLDEQELVFAIKEHGIVKVYPVRILDGHEIVNDFIDTLYFAVTYCPQTKSGICINRKIKGKITEFGVSGMLYNDNLMPYDRNTESIWSQMLEKCVSGELVTEEFEVLMMIRINWVTIKKAYPQALVLIEPNLKNSNKSIGFSQSGSYYGMLKRFGVELYSYESLKEQASIIEGQEIIIGNSSYDYITAFKQNGSKGFSYVIDSLPVIMVDASGNRFDLFGYIVEGTDKGQRLEAVSSYSALLWAWEAFYEIEDILDF
jgi:hypothetical protein